MQVTIDVLDGTGPLDYGSAIEAKHPLKIVRKLNEPSTCTFGVLRNNNTSQSLLRNSRIVVSDGNGMFYFTGYMATEPVLEYLGMGVEGPSYCAIVSAISDEYLLDKEALSRSGSTSGQTIATLLTNLTIDAGRLVDTSGVTGTRVVGHFHINETDTWSENALTLASSVRSSYRVLNGKLNLASVGATVHQLSDGDGTLQVNAFTASRRKMLVNDVTLCGEEEPAAYVTELFEGDGTTAVFNLTANPFAITGNGSTWCEDTFTSADIDTRVWQLVDSGSFVNVTSAGLTFKGGRGIEGETYLRSLNTLEVGGSLLLEAGGVVVGAGSDGLLLSLMQGVAMEDTCFAGFRVKQDAGNMYLVPVIGGAESGASFPIIAGHLYTLRLRINCVEPQRLLESFYSVGDSGIQQYGGDPVAAAANLVIEVQESANGIPAAAVVLYDGLVSEAPAVCSLVLASSTNLTCSVRSIRVRGRAPVWVSIAPQNGGWVTKRVGSNSTDGDCSLDAAGVLRFFAGKVPLNGDCISVCYRTSARSVARLSQQESVAREQVGSIPGTSRMTGTLTRPKARSSADCENAAAALLNVCCSRSAAIEGKYVMSRVDGDSQQDDVWPGDMLGMDFASGGIEAAVVIREVTLEALPTAPGWVRYTAYFANDWARELSLWISSAVPAGAWIPQISNIQVLGNLPSMSVSVHGGNIAVDAGVTPPPGGGFEVRRKDWAFRAGLDSDLVLRSPVQHFTIPRWAAAEQYYVRMYDASTPPLYSRASSAVFLNLPM